MFRGNRLIINEWCREACPGVNGFIGEVKYCFPDPVWWRVTLVRDDSVTHMEYCFHLAVVVMKRKVFKPPSDTVGTPGEWCVPARVVRICKGITFTWIKIGLKPAIGNRTSSNNPEDSSVGQLDGIISAVGS